MSERGEYRPRVLLHSIEPSFGPEYESGLMRDLEKLAYVLFFKEYRIDWNLPELPEREKERFRQHPEQFLRDYLVEAGFPHTINALAIHGEAEECLTEATAKKPKPDPKLVHVERHNYASTYVIK